MASKSAIEWTDATVNFWWGCTKVGPGCDHCYAEMWAKRTGHSVWGQSVPRRKIDSAAALLQRLNRGAVKFADENDGRVRRAFIQSMSDLFDLEVELSWFAEAWAGIEAADCLDIQIVTKRITAVEKRLAELGRTTWPKHAGLIITVVNQAEADRDVPRLLALKSRLHIPWIGLSIEPMLGPIDLMMLRSGDKAFDALQGAHAFLDGDSYEHAGTCAKLDWVIVGGESGKDARPIHPQWARDVRDQCESNGVPFFFKQWGEWLPDHQSYDPTPYANARAAHRFPDNSIASRVGKKAAGRLLDGKTHDAFPMVAS